MKTGIELITEEREEQLKKHGFDKEHDKEHTNDSLSWNASVLASPYVLYTKHKLANGIHFMKATIDNHWKLPNQNYKPHGSNVIIDNCELSGKERIKQLTVAGALIAAEIDRIKFI